MAIIYVSTNTEAGENKERELLYTVDGNVNWHRQYGKQYEVSSKD